MAFDLERSIQFLFHTPAVVRSFLEGLPPEWVTSNEGQGSWSPRDILSHLIHGERTDWLVRTKQILEAEPGEVPEFRPFDRQGHAVPEMEERTLAGLQDLFGELRRTNIHALKAFDLAPEDLARKGKHPDFGPVSLEQLLSTWVVHDLDHLAQLSRVCAHQLADQVGPWKSYLRVLTGTPT